MMNSKKGFFCVYFRIQYFLSMSFPQKKQAHSTANSMDPYLIILSVV